MLLALGIGMSVSNARAVVEALLGHTTDFVRTPKYRIERAGDGWQEKRYRGLAGFLPYAEVGLGLYFTVALAYAVSHAILGSIPFLALFQVGFLYTGLVSLRESRPARGRPSAGFGLGAPASSLPSAQ